ncbi:MAG: class I SAM-dependent methyltransferase [Proteobacteria bacterium]|jgi:SAM-dependent methyltransferase|nr:class I SAM-dependent methyltransferase [Pseudomonadota bacterium]
MAHPQQAEYFGSVRDAYPGFFRGVRVLEVGSLDINGSLRPLFEGCEYTGADLQLGPGVDLACPGQLLEFPSGHFDTVVSAECLEHNPFWRETLANMLRMTRPGGLVLVSCATTGRKEHGTTRTNPDASPFTVAARWDYYRNLRARDVERGVHLPGWLADWRFWTNYVSRDLYFAGLRHGGEAALDATLLAALDRRYALGASAKSLRRGVKSRLIGDLLSHG